MADKAGIANEVVGAAVANKVTQVGAAAGLTGWLMSVNWIGWAGVAIALAGFGVNLYFQHRRDKREQAEREERRWREEREHQLRMDALKERCRV